MKKLIATSLTAATYFSFASSALAAGNLSPCPTGQFTSLCNLSSNNLGSYVGAAVTFILIAATLIALFFLIYGGIRWITSSGDKAKVDSARQTITAAIIGLIIAFLAFFILSVVLTFFGLSLTNLALPTITAV